MKAVPKIQVGIGLINTALFTICAFSTYFDRDVSGFLLSAEPLLLLLSLISILSCLGWAVYLHKNGAKSERNSLLLFALGVPLLTAALLVNLKRGPWVGVTIGSIVLGALYARKLLLPLLASIAILCATVPPLQARLAESSQNFF